MDMSAKNKLTALNAKKHIGMVKTGKDAVLSLKFNSDVETPKAMDKSVAKLNKAKPML